MLILSLGLLFAVSGIAAMLVVIHCLLRATVCYRETLAALNGCDDATVTVRELAPAAWQPLHRGQPVAAMPFSRPAALRRPRPAGLPTLRAAA